jgi:hypothetical protein
MPRTHNPALFRHVADDYRHYAKQARPVAALVADDVHLKWYSLAVPERRHSTADIARAQEFMLGEIRGGRLELTNEVGFVVQHRVRDADIFYACSWNGNNELWETHYYLAHRPDATFEIGRHGTKFPTFCVWVLAIVAHEKKAWSAYLRSARDRVARETYLGDQLDALVE